MVHVVIFQNTQQLGCVYRLVRDSLDTTHQTPHALISQGGGRYVRREAYDWSTQGQFASELALAIDHQPFFWECRRRQLAIPITAMCGTVNAANPTNTTRMTRVSADTDDHSQAKPSKPITAAAV